MTPNLPTATYQVYAIAHVEVHIGEVEAETSGDAWTLASAIFKEKRGKTVKPSEICDDPTIEELHAVVKE